MATATAPMASSVLRTLIGPALAPTACFKVDMSSLSVMRVRPYHGSHGSKTWSPYPPLKLHILPALKPAEKRDGCYRSW
jgi:hypothetical protein